MNNFILGILLAINKIIYYFSKSKKGEIDPLTRKVKRCSCKYESRRIMIHESGKTEEIVSCMRPGLDYHVACLHFHELCIFGIESQSYIFEGSYDCRPKVIENLKLRNH